MNLKKKEKASVSKKKATGKKKITAKKSTGVKKNKKPVTKVSSTKKANPKKILQKKAIAKKTAKPKVKRSPDKPVIEAVEINLPPVEEKSSNVNNGMDMEPHTEMKKIRQKEIQNYDKHQIRLSSVRKGGPKPSGKKPLW